MYKFLDLDFRAIRTELSGRDYIRSSEILGPTESVFRTREHGYRRIDDGAFFHMMDFEVGQSYSLRMSRPEFVCIQLVVRGTYSRSISHHVESVEPATIDVTNAPSSISDTQAGSRLRGVLIVCDREYFVDRFRLNIDRIPEAYRPIFTSSAGAPSALRLPIGSSAIVAANQMLSCRYDEPLRHLYLNAKAMEIICGVVAQINGLSPQQRLRSPAARDKTTAIEAAAAIYREDFNAPTIEQLATRVGLNRNDFMKGFREAYGVTPHEYRHSLRMEEARRMLREEQLSISQVARRIGYEGYSSFARAYRSYFGHPPSAPKPKLSP
jgi:AraC-like DNA-binding protein